MLRILAVAGGVLTGAAAAQFPEFSQQYVQRLGGAVDALSEMVADFDASAQATGLSREAALTQMTGTAFLDRRRTDMIHTFDRHARLSADLEALDAAGPFARAAQIWRMTDRDVGQATYAAFVPAVPLSLTGGLFALCGVLLGMGIVRLVGGLILWPARRVRRAT